MIHPSLRSSSVPVHPGKGSAPVGLAAFLVTAWATTLAGGEAHALECAFGGYSGAADCITGIAYSTDPASDKQITLLSLPSAGAGEIRFGATPLPPPGFDGDLWQVIVDFNPSLVGAASGAFAYKLSITDPGYSFKDVQLAAMAPLEGVAIRKQVYSDAFTNLVEDLFINTTSNSGFVSFDSAYTDLWVRDTYTVGDGKILTLFENGYRQTEVPGPLPLLGAGAAFGISRKLRRRIRGARQLSRG
jgi:hypothetical protein